MRKTKPDIKPVAGKLTISKQAASIAKSLAGVDASKTGRASAPDGGKMPPMDEPTLAHQKEILAKFEAEVMGEQEENKGTKSEIRARNYEQMVGVLKHKLTALENAAKFRLHLCEEDLNKFSTKCSKQAPKITDDFEEFSSAQRAPRDNIKFTANHRDNLVSSDTVHVDATHLVVRTKQSTERGKKLESHLEESFGNVSVREMKGKKSKGAHRPNEKSKKSVKEKNDAKKQHRQKLEKDLHANMDNYLLRNVNDVDMKFFAPMNPEDEPNWPIPVKWPKQNPKFHDPDNADGQLDPELLLEYAIERITLQSGEGRFKSLIKLNMVQQYFLNLFWLVKLKFFQPDSTEHDEAYLLQCMSKEYVQIVEFMAHRSHAEYEKDYMFKFLPFILSNAIYFAFYFLFPASRHIFTPRAFRKTILVQVIQIMHGVQISQLSVKISWAKLFPEDVQEGADDEDETGELFPVQLAFSKRPKSANLYTQMHLGHHDHSKSVSHHVSSVPHLPMNATTVPSSPTVRTPHGGLVAGETGGLPPLPTTSLSTSNNNNSNSAAALGSARVQFSDTGTGTGTGDRPRTTSNISDSNNGIAFHDVTATSSSSQGKRKDASGTRTSTLSEEALIGKLPTVAPTERTMLKPSLEKPHGLQHLTIRQNKETVDAKEISPVMQQFLYQGSERGFRCAQPMARIAPISWCVAGGSDTHRRRQIPKQLLDEISQKAHASKKEYLDEIPKWRKRRLMTLVKINNACKQVLSSGQQSISRFSLDLIKQKRLHLKGGEKEAASSTLDDFGQDATAFLEKYANYEDEDIEKFLESIGENA